MRKKRKEWQGRNLNSEETSEEEKKRVSVAKPEQVRRGLGKKEKKRVSVAKPEQVRRGLGKKEKKRVSVAKPEQVRKQVRKKRKECQWRNLNK